MLLSLKGKQEELLEKERLPWKKNISEDWCVFIIAFFLIFVQNYNQINLSIFITPKLLYNYNPHKCVYNSRTV